MLKQVYLAGAARTAIGAFGGAFGESPAPTLGAAVIKAALQRAGVAKEQVDEVIFGNVLGAGLGQNPARQATIGSGLAATVDRRRCNSCGSVSSHAAEAAATAIEMKTRMSGSRIKGSTSVLDAHQARDDEGSDQLEGAGDEKQIDTPGIFPKHLHEIRRQDEQNRCQCRWQA